MHCTFALSIPRFVHDLDSDSHMPSQLSSRKGILPVELNRLLQPETVSISSHQSLHLMTGKFICESYFGTYVAQTILDVMDDVLRSLKLLFCYVEKTGEIDTSEVYSLFLP